MDGNLAGKRKRVQSFPIPMTEHQRFAAGFTLGLLLGLTCAFYGRGMILLISSFSPTSPAIIQCPSDVDTTHWKTFRSLSLAFEVRYPPSFDVVESSTGATLENAATKDHIVFEKFRGPLSAYTTEEMRLAGWKIADRQVYALTTPYFSNDDGSLAETYLFVRDFPLKGSDGPFVIIRASLTTERNNPSLLAAQNAGIVDGESILTEGEQILSTFRFLQFTELPGRDDGTK